MNMKVHARYKQYLQRLLRMSADRLFFSVVLIPIPFRIIGCVISMFLPYESTSGIIVSSVMSFLGLLAAWCILVSWFNAIVFEFNKNRVEERDFKVFKVCRLLVPIALLIATLFRFPFYQHTTIHEISSLVMFVSVFLLCRFVAKSFKRFELQREVVWDDFKWETAYLAIPIIGIYKLQPKINLFMIRKDKQQPNTE